MNSATKCKSILAVVLAIFMAFSCTVSAFAAITETNTSQIPDYVTNSTDKAIWAQGLTGATAKDISAVKWFKHSNGKYYLFMPTTTDLSNLTIYQNFSGDVKVNGTSIVSGNSYSIFADNGEYTLTAEGKSYTVVVMKSDSVGTMFLTTDTGSMDFVHSDKENKDPGYAVIVDQNGTIQYDNALDYIKGRGNTTWENIDKKPYNIKLSKKTSLFGMGKSKKWCLLANGQEHSMMRNRLMYDLADEVGLEYSVESRFVDLYANGEYLGSYLLTQKIEVGTSELVAQENLEDQTVKAVKALTGVKDVDLSTYSSYSSNNRYGFNIPADPADITGTYLVEYVYGVTEPSGFVTKRRQSADIKSPEFCSVAQINYIADFVQDMEDALYSSTGYNSKGKHYTDYIDAESAARMYLLQEISVNIDCGISSCFLYKESDITGDGKLHLGPAWDFDVALGNLTNTKDGVKMTDNQSWFAKIAKLYNNKNYTIIGAFANQSDFGDLVTKVWNEEFVPAFKVMFSEQEATGRLQSLDTYRQTVAKQATLNYVRWDYTLSTNLLVPSAGNTHEKQVDYLVNWITGRYNFLNASFASLEDAKVQAKATLQAFYDGYSQADYDAETWASFTKAKDDGMAAIDAATSSTNVATALDTAKNNMKKLLGVVLYFDNSEINWSSCYVYYWGSSLSSVNWPGVQMTKVDGTNYFKVSLPSDVSSCIFTNGQEQGNDKQQTINLIAQSPKKVFVPDMSSAVVDDAKQATVYSGVWTDYSPTVSDMLGDVDLDGKLTLRDVTLLQKYYAETVELTKQQQINADFDKNGVINMRDAYGIQNAIAA